VAPFCKIVCYHFLYKTKMLSLVDYSVYMQHTVTWANINRKAGVEVCREILSERLTMVLNRKVSVTGPGSTAS
jgi:hypothetical protein